MRIPLRSVEERVDFPAAMPYTDFMERFRQPDGGQLVAVVDLVASRVVTRCPGMGRVLS